MLPNPSSLNDSGNCFTWSKSSKSNSRLYNLGISVSVIPLSMRYVLTSSIAFSPLASDRDVSTTVAPAAANRLALSKPNPDVAPVIRTTVSIKDPLSGS